MLFYNLNTIMLFDNLKQYNAKYMYMLKLIHCEFTMKKINKKKWVKPQKRAKRVSQTYNHPKHVGPFQIFNPQKYPPINPQ